VHEYHAVSGVLVQEVAPGAVMNVYDVAFGADRQLYVASFGDNRIVRINVDTGAAINFVAPSAGGLKRPSGLTFGSDGNLYVVSQANSSVLKFSGVNGASMGVFVPSGSGSLFSPWQLVFGPNGNLFVVSSNNRILQYNGTTGAFINTFADVTGGLNSPRGLLFLPNGDLLVSNRAANTVSHFGPLGQPLGQYNDEYPLQQPWGMTLGRNGNVYIASTAGAVRIIEYGLTTGRYIRSWVRGDDALTTPTAFAFRPASAQDKNGNLLPDSCDGLCPADISGGDSIVNVADLLAVINAWGPCIHPNNCPPDIAPPGGDNVVNVADLLMVINSWGPCP
jgi:sugar lactone lactonase YvrE